MFFQPTILITNKSSSAENELREHLQDIRVDVRVENIFRFFSEKSTIGIENISKLNKLIYKVNDSPVVYVVEQAEKMTEEAQNCLLKTLEEPNRNSIIILITSNSERLLDTIRSRCIEINKQNQSTNEKENDSIFSQFINSDYIRRRRLIEDISKEENTREFALDLILYIMNFAKSNIPDITDRLIEIYKSIKQGSNIKLALENASILLN